MTQIKEIKDILNTVICGDCIENMKLLPDNCVDAIVSDPPAGISFMGKSWDTFDKSMFGKKGEEGSNDLKVKKNFDILPRYGNADLLGFQDFVCVAFTEAIRVLKPGGHALVWAIPRTSHHTAMGLERAGFEIRDIVHHHFGSGFPKSLNIGKKIDQLKGRERKVIGDNPNNRPNAGSVIYELGFRKKKGNACKLTAGESPWEGWGTALKPATEHWILIRKPLENGLTIVENVLKWGVGGLNIDISKIKGEPWKWGTQTDLKGGGLCTKRPSAGNVMARNVKGGADGRWPANLTLECTCEEVVEGTAQGSPGHWGKTKTTGFGKFGGGKSEYKGAGPKADMKCLVHTNPLCPCYILDKQSGMGVSQKHDGDGRPLDTQGMGWGFKRFPGGFTDTGGASRFFYTAKASRSERDYGCGNIEPKKIDTGRKDGNPGGDNPRNRGVHSRSNFHPTVKPLSLMKYLINLIVPEHGIVLDPFAGSGSTLVAAKTTGHDFIGIEKDPEYHRVCLARINSTEKSLF